MATVTTLDRCETHTHTHTHNRSSFPPLLSLSTSSLYKKKKETLVTKSRHPQRHLLPYPAPQATRTTAVTTAPAPPTLLPFRHRSLDLLGHDPAAVLGDDLGEQAHRLEVLHDVGRLVGDDDEVHTLQGLEEVPHVVRLQCVRLERDGDAMLSGRVELHVLVGKSSDDNPST